MKKKPAPTPIAPSEQPVPLASYFAEYEKWLRTSKRCQKNREAEDIRQEIRLALWELRDVPVTREQAREVFLRLAGRFESRARREVYRQGALVERPEDFAQSVERDAVRILALFKALEKLSDEERWVVKECKIEGRSNIDVAQDLGVSDHTVGNRLWRAMTKFLAIFKDEVKRIEEDGAEKPRNDRKSGAIVAPLAFEFTHNECAAFSAVWRAEGRIPTFGDGPPNPPDPPNAPSPPGSPIPPIPPAVVPGFSPIAVAPIVSAAAKSVVSGASIAIVILLLALLPTGVVAIYYFWEPPAAQTAQKHDFRVPTVTVVDDVVPMDYVPPRDSSSAEPVAGASSAPISTPPLSKSSISRHGDAPSAHPAHLDHRFHAIVIACSAPS